MGSWLQRELGGFSAVVVASQWAMGWEEGVELVPGHLSSLDLQVQ
jgi:hypothetical protein